MNPLSINQALGQLQSLAGTEVIVFGGCAHFSQFPAEILARTMERYKHRPEAVGA